jgi:bifunctional enzyme CysN/CysC
MEEKSVSSESQRSDVTSDERNARFGQKPATVLLTGLTGTGKSTIARAVERLLFDGGRAVTVMDGELMRRGVNVDLGYSTEDRSENLRRSSHIARLFNDAGLICVAAFLAPSQSVRDRVADVIGRDRFLIVYCDADEATRKARDTKGHYAQAESGKMPNFPGVSAVYEAPEDADLVLDTARMSVQQCAEAVVTMLAKRGFIR